VTGFLDRSTAGNVLQVQSAQCPALLAVQCACPGGLHLTPHLLRSWTWRALRGSHAQWELRLSSAGPWMHQVLWCAPGDLACNPIGLGTLGPYLAEALASNWIILSFSIKTGRWSPTHSGRFDRTFCYKDVCSGLHSCVSQLNYCRVDTLRYQRPDSPIHAHFQVAAETTLSRRYIMAHDSALGPPSTTVTCTQGFLTQDPHAGGCAPHWTLRMRKHITTLCTPSHPPRPEISCMAPAHPRYAGVPAAV
jgi:hypothetical protein